MIVFYRAGGILFFDDSLWHVRVECGGRGLYVHLCVCVVSGVCCICVVSVFCVSLCGVCSSVCVYVGVRCVWRVC